MSAQWHLSKVGGLDSFLLRPSQHAKRDKNELRKLSHAFKSLLPPDLQIREQISVKHQMAEHSANTMLDSLAVLFFPHQGQRLNSFELCHQAHSPVHTRGTQKHLLNIDSYLFRPLHNVVPTLFA